MVLDLRPARVTAFDLQGRVSDHANSKVLILRPNGSVEREIRVPMPTRRLSPIGRGTGWYAITPSDQATIATAYDSLGLTRQAVAAPAYLQQLNLSQRESYVIAAPDGGAIVGFRWASMRYKITPQGQLTDSLAASRTWNLQQR